MALYDKAIAWGCESVMEPTHLDRWPVQMAYIKDPDGYLIEIGQATGMLRGIYADRHAEDG